MSAKRTTFSFKDCQKVVKLTLWLRLLSSLEKLLLFLLPKTNLTIFCQTPGLCVSKRTNLLVKRSKDSTSKKQRMETICW